MTYITVPGQVAFLSSLRRSDDLARGTWPPVSVSTAGQFHVCHCQITAGSDQTTKCIFSEITHKPLQFRETQLQVPNSSPVPWKHVCRRGPIVLVYASKAGSQKKKKILCRFCTLPSFLRIRTRVSVNCKPDYLSSRPDVLHIDPDYHYWRGNNRNRVRH